MFLCSWSHRLRPEKLQASVAVPAAPVRVPSQRPLAPSVTSVANAKGDFVGVCAIWGVGTILEEA